MKWYFIDESITDGERRQGPYSIDEIREFVNQGKITETTLVWHSGEEDWKPWSAYKEEFSAPDDADLAREELLENTIKALEEVMKKEQFARYHYAGFFTRAAAYIVDNLILGFICGGILFILSATGVVDFPALQEALNSLADSASTTETVSKLPSIRGVSLFIGILNVIQALYFIIFHAIYSATPGKMLVHIHVETREGAKIGWGGATARYLCSILTQMTLFFYGLGYLIVCIDPRRRALHDWIARTSVVFNEEARISKAPRSESNDESKEN